MASSVQKQTRSGSPSSASLRNSSSFLLIPLVRSAADACLIFSRLIGGSFTSGHVSGWPRLKNASVSTVPSTVIEGALLVAEAGGCGAAPSRTAIAAASASALLLSHSASGIGGGMLSRVFG